MVDNMTNSRNILENREVCNSVNQLSYFDCASISAYNVFRGLRESLTGGGAPARGEALFSSAVSDHVICVASSSSSPG